MSEPILRVASVLSFQAGHSVAKLEPFELHAGEWAALLPSRSTPGPDLAIGAARVFGTLCAPDAGSIELLGSALLSLPYMELLELRAKLGFVPGAGGLLSNRTLRQNIAMPVYTHRALRPSEEDALVQRLVDELGLTRVADQRPHEVSGSTRFRACVARALVLSPPWLVIEGTGDFDLDQESESAWEKLMAYKREHTSAAVVCLARHNPAFERWFVGQGGRVIRYRLLSEPPSPRERSTVQ